MSIPTAEEVIPPHILKYEREKHALLDRVKRNSKPRVRLCVQDFEERGIDITQELWDTVMQIKEPALKADKLLALLKFIFPTISSISVSHEIKSESTQKLDLSGVDPAQLVALMREKMLKEKG